MKIVTTVQQQHNNHPASSCVQMGRVFQRQESVITSRTATTAWMKLIVLAPTQHNGAVQKVVNVSLLVISVMEQRNVHKAKMKRTVLRCYQQQLLQPRLVFQVHYHQLHILPPPRLSKFQSVLEETNRTE